jgi:hypothetical protein
MILATTLFRVQERSGLGGNMWSFESGISETLMETTLGLSWALPRNLVKGNLKRGRSGSDDPSRRSGAIPEYAYEGSPSREIIAWTLRG